MEGDGDVLAFADRLFHPFQGDLTTRLPTTSWCPDRIEDRDARSIEHGEGIGESARG